MWRQEPIFRFEIDKFSEMENGIASDVFVSGGCEWYLNVWPKGYHPIGDELSVFLYVANQKSLGTGWKRTASYYYVALNESNKELYKSAVEPQRVFQAESPGWAFRKTWGISKFQEKGFLENDKLIIEVYLDVVEAVDREGSNVSEKKKKKKEIVEINGFRVFAFQVTQVTNIFAEYPDVAEYFKPKNQVVRTEYMNVLLSLIETLDKPLHSISETEISNAHSELSELMDEGFKLDWLKKRLESISLEKSGDVLDGFRVQQLEERVRNLELMLKLEEGSMERKKAYESRIQQLEESVKKLELIVSDLKVELDKAKAKSSDADFLLVDEVA